MTLFTAALCALGCFFLLLNLLAFFHARAMTHFRRAGEKEPPPGEMAFTDRLRVIVFGFLALRSHNEQTPDAIGQPWTFHEFGSPGHRLRGWHIPSRACTAAAGVPQSPERGLVVMCPPFGGCKGKLLSEAQSFLSMGFSVFLFDFYGHGDSDGDSTTLGWREADDVAATLAYVRAEPSLAAFVAGKPVIGYGQSMGSVALLRAAARGAELDGLILENPFDSLRGTVKNRVRAMMLPPWGLAELLVFWGGLQHGFNGFAHSSVAYARSLRKRMGTRCSVLVLHGQADPWVTPKQALAVAEAGAGERVLFDGHGHGPCREADTDLWDQSIRIFLQPLS